MKTKTSMVTGSSFGILAAMAIGWGVLPTAYAAETECYDFADLADKEYRVGDTIDAKHALITLKDFKLHKPNPVEAERQYAKPMASVIARGTAPELHMYLINAAVKPNAPVKRVTLKYAESTGGDLTGNIEVNGDKHIAKDGLAQADGKVIGKKPVGKAKVSVTVTEQAPSDQAGWNRGTLKLHATRGAIESFSIGGNQLYIDDVCFEKSESARKPRSEKQSKSSTVRGGGADKKEGGTRLNFSVPITINE